MVAIITLSIIGGLILILVLWLVATYNGFVSLKNKIDEAFSTMDVCLKKRYDLVPNFVTVVKSYATHEKETFQKVVAARNMAVNAKTIDEKVEGEKALSGTLKTLFAVAENYPELKADKSYVNLQETLKGLESEIASSRKYYNGVVKMFNTKRERFPSNLVAGWFKFEKRSLFEIENVEERNNVKIEM